MSAASGKLRGSLDGGAPQSAPPAGQPHAHDGSAPRRPRHGPRWRIKQALHVTFAAGAAYLLLHLCLYVALRDSRLFLTLFLSRGTGL